MEPCPRCGQRRVLRPEQNLCGMCVRRARPRKEPTPRNCDQCGRLAKHAAHRLCTACYQRTHNSLIDRTAAALIRLGASIPDWFEPLVEDIGDRFVSAVAVRHLRQIEHHLIQGACTPEALVRALRSPGRSPGDTTRIVNEYFDTNGLGSFLQDEEDRRSAGRRERRVARAPLPFRPAVAAFSDYLLRSRARANLVGGRGLKDATIEARLADVAALANFLERRGINDWAAVTAGDIEEFLGSRSRHRLASFRMFSTFARKKKLILINPALGLTRPRPTGFAGRTLNSTEQRRLIHRWRLTTIDPRERVVGLFALLHGMTSSQIRTVLISDINTKAGTIVIAGRPYHVPLDPITLAAIDAVLTTRLTLRTNNPHLILTKDSRAHETAASPYFMTHILDPAGVTLAVLRQTRLADLAHSHDPRLVAAAFGMTAGGALHYVFDAVDREEEVFASTHED
ncbi:hypothetical protein SAMN05216368_10526 [Cryobacterium flavum]|uniref:Core-binding (CB) domain-containing protein n=1 Tax=Cryobacterium flavum TaxID=1424659 RepID=A0A5E9FYQ0_9MICO|nr:hypothetical protein SAMN05216368_10526 [Cryobacterium flavum]